MRRPHRSCDYSGRDRPLCTEDLGVHASDSNPDGGEALAQRVHERGRSAQVVVTPSIGTPAASSASGVMRPTAW